MNATLWLLVIIVVILLVALCGLMTASGLDTPPEALDSASNPATRPDLAQSRCTGNCNQGRNCSCAPAAIDAAAAAARRIMARAKVAALYDARHSGRRMAGPYTIGSIEHATWRAVYDVEFMLATSEASCQAT
jgi:hypothetical protein